MKLPVREVRRYGRTHGPGGFKHGTDVECLFATSSTRIGRATKTVRPFFVEAMLGPAVQAVGTLTASLPVFAM